MCEFLNELNGFWKWAKMTEDKYALYECKEKPIEEYFYPNWEKLLTCAKEALINAKDDSNLLYALTVLGLDNEPEHLLDFCKTLTIQRKIYIAKFGLNHLFSETRWQIAELLGTVNSEESMTLLNQLLQDANWYVRKRASNSLENLKNIQ